MNKIVYGGRTFTDHEIESGSIHLTISLTSAQLEANTFTAVVRSEDPKLAEFERNTQLTFFRDDRQICIAYVQTIDRVAADRYKIYATSAVGLLIEGQHMGGIYTGQTAKELISDICGTVPFFVKSNLEEIKLYGWLPIASPRDNLSQVLFALGAALKTDLDGVLRIEGLWDGISSTVPKIRMYEGANMDYEGKVTQVIVNEHQYVPWTEEKQLFEGTAQRGDIITFDEPMHSLKASGFTILSSGANWAKVSAGSGVLSGKTYLHNTRQISKDVFPAKDPNVKTVKDATLVSLVNSQACAQRLADYYKCRERVDSSVVYHGEAPGDRLSTYHPFDKTGVAACLESADITLSGTLKAQEKSLVGFVPKKIEQVVTYDYHEVLTGSGTWVVPDGVTSILAVLIGGGGAGFDGESGTAGSGIGWADGYRSNSDNATLRNGETANLSASVTSSTKGPISEGLGGKGGLSGTPGKILQTEYDVLSKSHIAYSCGRGGISNGEAGTDTTFGEYSSFDGTVSPTGFTDVISGETYAKPGVSGLSGADGGSPGSDGKSVDGVSGGKGYSGTTKNYSKNNIGGPGHSTRLYYSNGAATAEFRLPGIGGGGAGGRSGNNLGSEGQTGYVSTPNFDAGIASKYPESSGSISGSRGGNGGKGANGASGQEYGSAGNGGGGGGGPGGCEKTSVTTKISITAKNTEPSSSDTSYVAYPNIHAYAWTASDNNGGTGGAGGAGGAGAPGCIILYYGVKHEIPAGQFVDKNGKTFLDHFSRRLIV